MDLDFVAGRLITGSPRRSRALIVVAMIAVLIMALAGSAHAANVATTWGLNDSGQLGIGTSTGPEKCGSEQKACSTTPMKVSNLSGIMAVAGGGDDSLALLESRTVMAWGSGTSGQLGDGKTEGSDVPVAVCAAGETAPCAKELGGVRAIAGGERHSLALLE